MVQIELCALNLVGREYGAGVSRRHFGWSGARYSREKKQPVWESCAEILWIMCAIWGGMEAGDDVECHQPQNNCSLGSGIFLHPYI